MKRPNQNKNFQVEKNTIINLEKGRIPPQALDLEEVILGACLLDKKGFPEVVAIIREEKDVFYKDAHQHIYDAMLDLFNSDEPIDLLTVSHKLKEYQKLDLVGGDFYLIELTQKVSSSAHIEQHCRIVMQMYVKRKSIQVASKIFEEAYDETKDIFDLLADSQKELDDTADWLIKKPPSSFKTVVDSFFEKVENNTPGIPSALSKLQNKMNGWQDEDLIIVAARPGMGKTALILSEAYYQAKQDIPIGIFSLEMSAKDLTGRLFANECGIDASKIKKNKLDDFEKRLMAQKRHEFSKLPIHIHDQAGLSPMEVKIQAGKWIREHGVKMIYVDYLQLMDASGKNKTGNREQEISSISRSLKAIAKDLEIPVVALSQLSRAVENRGGMKRPLLSDLRESGAIEQDADIVAFLLRPEYYNIDEWDDDDRTSTAGQCEINFAKFRGGETGATVVGCDLKYMRFFDLEDKFEPYQAKPQEPEDVFEVSQQDQIHDDFAEEDDDLPF